MASARSIIPLSPIVWIPKVGEEHIDQEHQQLKVDINELTNLLFDGRAWASVVAKAEELRRDTIAHFQSEEKVLERAAYPKLSQHRAEHRRIAPQLDDIVQHLVQVQRPTRTDIEAALYLRSLLLDHFFRKDIAYKSHLLKSKGE